MVDDVGVGNAAVRVDLGYSLRKTAVSVIGEGGEAAGCGAVLSGLGDIKGKGLVQLAEDVLCDLGIVVKVRTLFRLLYEIALHVIRRIQGEVAGLALFIGEAGGNIQQLTKIVERVGGYAGGQTVCGLDGLRELVAGLRIVDRGYCGVHERGTDHSICGGSGKRSFPSSDEGTGGRSAGAACC